MGWLDPNIGISEISPTFGGVSSYMNENMLEEAYDPDAFVAVIISVYNRFGDKRISSESINCIECLTLDEKMLIVDTSNQFDCGLEVKRKVSES